MDTDNQLTFEGLLTTSLQDFYKLVNEIMLDFKFSIHHNIRDVPDKRRIELWTSIKNENDRAVFWIEMLKADESHDPYLTTDILRTMNDEDVTRLFFFTNSYLDDSDRALLEGDSSYVFTSDEIIETLQALEKKKSVKTVRRRKQVKIPSAMVLIKNFLRNNPGKRPTTKIKTSSIPELINQYVRLVRRILDQVDQIPDINDLMPELRERFKRLQFDLLPELVKTPSYTFIPRFGYLRNTLFALVEYTIVYLGNIIEYESEEDLKHNRDTIDDLCEKLQLVDDEILDYKQELMQTSEKISTRLIVYSAVVLTVFLAIFIAMKLAK